MCNVMFFFPTQFKKIVSAAFDNAPVGQLCLIYTGKILKDDSSLESYGKELSWFTFSCFRNMQEVRVANSLPT